jgi:8-oxo-dGTP pyrophosphatase MutT (NUDIX family)
MEKFAAGIVPYTFFNNKTYFLLGLEKSNKKWSGFVGTSENGEMPLETAIREFNEETSMIFNYNYFYSKIMNGLPDIDKTKTGKTVYIWFIECPSELIFMDLNIFHENQSKTNDPCLKEKSDLRWFSLVEIKNENVLYRLKQVIFKKFNIKEIYGF